MRINLIILSVIKYQTIEFYIDYSGVVVSQYEPTEELGIFWGYNVRVA